MSIYEAEVWDKLHHPNIAEFLGIVDQPVGTIDIVSTYYDNGNLSKYLVVNPCANRNEFVSVEILHLKFLTPTQGISICGGSGVSTWY
jgi:hypothetical protein